VTLEHDEISLSCDRSGGGLPLPLGEGWGEGLRSLVKQRPLTRFAAQIDLSPPGRGGLSPRPNRFDQKSFVFNPDFAALHPGYGAKPGMTNSWQNVVASSPTKHSGNTNLPRAIERATASASAASISTPASATAIASRWSRLPAACACAPSMSAATTSTDRARIARNGNPDRANDRGFSWWSTSRQRSRCPQGLRARSGSR
jgi:hypothetical protein